LWFNFSTWFRRRLFKFTFGIVDKKPKFQAIDVFRSKKKEKEALTSKQTEMEKQKMECRSFLSSRMMNYFYGVIVWLVWMSLWSGIPQTKRKHFV
jgi:hypothetical protein